MARKPALDVQTHYRRRPSDLSKLSMPPPPVPMPRLHTRRSRKYSRVPKSRADHPLKSPEQVIFSDGSRMKLVKPKQHMADMAAKRREKAKLPKSPGSMRRPTKPRYPATPKYQPSNDGLVRVPVLGTHQIVSRPQDPTLLSVQLLRVVRESQSRDTQNQRGWSLMNGLLNGRIEEWDRDRGRMWDTLGSTVYKVWPDLRGWIMSHTPVDNDDWVVKGESITLFEEWCMDDPNIATKYSSQTPVGFYMSSTAYAAACRIIQKLAERQMGFLNLMDSGINPFFVIYACADCRVLLPADFSRELLWKHLDAIIRAKCWRGLGPRNPPSDVGDVPRKYSRKDLQQDPEHIVRKLLALSIGGRAPAPNPGPVYQLKIAISKHEWTMKAQVGIVRYKAGDLDESDIASLAVIDALTRVLPYCRGGILEILSNDVRLLWGIYSVAFGDPSGAWSVVGYVCKSYRVELRVKWAALREPNTDLLVNSPYIAPQKDPAVVSLVLDKMRDDAVDQTMIRHLAV